MNESFSKAPLPELVKNGFDGRRGAGASSVGRFAFWFLPGGPPFPRLGVGPVPGFAAGPVPSVAFSGSFLLPLFPHLAAIVGIGKKAPHVGGCILDLPDGLGSKLLGGDCRARDSTVRPQSEFNHLAPAETPRHRPKPCTIQTGVVLKVNLCAQPVCFSPS